MSSWKMFEYFRVLRFNLAHVWMNFKEFLHKLDIFTEEIRKGYIVLKLRGRKATSIHHISGLGLQAPCIRKFYPLENLSVLMRFCVILLHKCVLPLTV